MNLTITRSGDVTVVRVGEARLMYPLLSDFASSVTSLVNAGERKLVIDLAGVSYIDSASIGCLMDIHRLLVDKGGAVRLCGLQSRVGTMLSMTGVHKIVDIVPDVEAALAAFGPRSEERDDA
jgi:anti-anti-sigma factor